MKGGALLVIAGAWVLCQVFGGDALGRLGIAGSGTPAPPKGGNPSAKGDSGLGPGGQSGGGAGGGGGGSF